ncbi:MAG: hypothetical protein PHI58_06145 [Candidatus Omnitrophica bacterium]|nr:hypothetical protein [Candidatus Omnitrophota bacterium]
MKTKSTIIFTIGLAMSLAAACYAAEGDEQKGLFSKGSFLSDAITSVTGKFDNIASGGERVVSDDAKGLPQGVLEYDGNPLGRPLPKPTYDYRDKEE